MCQGMDEASTCLGSDTYLLDQQLDRCLALADSLKAAVRVFLSTISSTDEAMHDLGNFTFVASRLLSLVRSHSSEIAEIIRIIDRLE